MMTFNDSIKKAVQVFNKIDKKASVKIISHFDCDGISACAILVNALNNENMRYSVSIIPQLNQSMIKDLSKESHDVYFFLDLGSGQIDLISKLFNGKKVFVFDHHMIPEKNNIGKVIFVNPHLNGISGSTEISSSGIIYLFTEKLNKKNIEMIHVAIIGAIGDSQENDGFIGLNDKIYKKALKEGKIQVQKGIKLFGRQSKPLHKILQLSTNPYIPGVTGSEVKALEFLNSIGISPRVGSTWKKFIHLDEGERETLAKAIIKQRKNEKKPDDIYGNIYILPNEHEESPTRDVREFSTVLNACGRLDKSALGIGACLGDKKIKKKAINQLKSYKHEILSAMNWYSNNKKTNKIIKGKGYVIINAENKILSTIIGTITSIISKSGEYDNNTFILTMGDKEDKTTKASLRIAGNKIRKDINLKDIITDICKNFSECIYGGHKNASGTVIPSSKKNEFIESAKSLFDKISMEEFIEEV